MRTTDKTWAVAGFVKNCSGSWNKFWTAERSEGGISNFVGRLLFHSTGERERETDRDFSLWGKWMVWIRYVKTNTVIAKKKKKEKSRKREILHSSNFYWKDMIEYVNVDSPLFFFKKYFKGIYILFLSSIYLSSFLKGETFFSLTSLTESESGCDS